MRNIIALFSIVLSMYFIGSASARPPRFQFELTVPPRYDYSAPRYDFRGPRFHFQYNYGPVHPYLVPPYYPNYNQPPFPYPRYDKYNGWQNLEPRQERHQYRHGREFDKNVPAPYPYGYNNHRSPRH